MSGRFESLAEQHLEIKVRGTSEFMCRCPFCDGPTSLQFNIDKGLWVCFRCDEKGNSKKLVQKLGGIYADPEVSVAHLRTSLGKAQPDYSEEKETVLPESHLNRYQSDFFDYWKNRGFTDNTIKQWNLGYDPLLDRAIIPYRNLEGGLLGVIQRRMGNVFPRYIYPEGFDRNSSLFGSWKIAGNNVVITEGSLDAIKVHQAGRLAVAQYGSSIHPFQVDLLRKMNIWKIVMFYDYDEAGLKALYKSQTLLDDFALWTVKWDEESYCWHEKLCGCGEHTWKEIGKCNHKYYCRCGRLHGIDPGDLTSSQIRNMVDNAVYVGGRTKSC